MGPLSESEYERQVEGSDMFRKYKNKLDTESAFEILEERMKEERDVADEEKAGKSARKEKSTFEEVISSPVAKQVGRELVRVFSVAIRNRGGATEKGGFF